MGETRDEEQRSMHLENGEKGQSETLLLFNDPESSSVTNYRAFAAPEDCGNLGEFYLPVQTEIRSVKSTQNDK